jgi:hypothetical protein
MTAGNGRLTWTAFLSADTGCEASLPIWPGHAPLRGRPEVIPTPTDAEWREFLWSRMQSRAVPPRPVTRSWRACVLECAAAWAAGLLLVWAV